MSAVTPADGRTSERAGRDLHPVTHDAPRRLSTETKSAFKTTEFIAYIVVLAGILVAGLVTKASAYGANHDPHSRLHGEPRDRQGRQSPALRRKGLGTGHLGEACGADNRSRTHSP